jgi:hypothetical protein
MLASGQDRHGRYEFFRINRLGQVHLKAAAQRPLAAVAATAALASGMAARTGITADHAATLRGRREQLKLSPDQLSRATKISIATLRAIEDNEIERLPGGSSPEGS